MDYIINPYWFYWIEVSDTIKGISIGALIFLIIMCIVVSILMTMSYGFDEKEYQTLKKVLVQCVVFLCVSALVLIIVPSKRTLMEMQIARLATRSNVDLTIDKVKEIVDYIINAMKEMK